MNNSEHNKHNVIFLDINSDDCFSVVAYCKTCRSKITDEELKQYLFTVNTSDVVEQIYSAFLSKRSYYEISTKLAMRGINSSILPVVVNNE